MADGKILLSVNNGSLEEKLILVGLGIEAMIEQNFAAMYGSAGSRSFSETTCIAEY